MRDCPELENRALSLFATTVRRERERENLKLGIRSLKEKQEEAAMYVNPEKLVLPTGSVLPYCLLHLTNCEVKLFNFRSIQ